MSGVNHVLDQPQKGWVERLIQVGNRVIAPVGRKAVLNQVIGPDTEEVDLLSQLIGIQCSQWHFDHHSDLDVVA